MKTKPKTAKAALEQAKRDALERAASPVFERGWPFHINELARRMFNAGRRFERERKRPV